jgi:hypothetical protein
MKTKKWLWVTLVSILTLVVLTGVAAAGYRLGLSQNPAVIQQFAQMRAQRFSQFQNQSGKPVNPQGQGNAPQQNQNNNSAPAPQQNAQGQGNVPQQFPPNGMMNPGWQQGFDQRGNFNQGFDPRSNFNRGFDRFDRRDNRGRDGFASPLFGLIHLLILGALIWFGYKYAKNSGWKLVREVPQPASPVAESAPIEGEQKE